ncbi:unnamed protein product [Paramecium primaurelia]|uniref:Uncharacterized protein n=1 Tax=Paramecium primaurelia TaxID=5886 RepID=A0A8S1MRK9_PARPR|nr:unnamed protein product [Paramecium primaurelia]
MMPLAKESKKNLKKQLHLGKSQNIFLMYFIYWFSLSFWCRISAYKEGFNNKNSLSRFGVMKAFKSGLGQLNITFDKLEDTRHTSFSLILQSVEPIFKANIILKNFDKNTTIFSKKGLIIKRYARGSLK